MENNTSLAPDTLRIIIRDYKNSFLFIFKNKWLYWIPIFFVFCEAVTQNSIRLLSKFLYPDLYKPSRFLENIYQTSLSEKLVTALSLISWPNILSSLFLLGIFNLLGVLIALLLLYKKIKNLFKLPFAKKVKKYSFFAFLFGLVISLISYLFFKNIVIISLGILIGFIGIQVLLILLFTLIGAVFISFLRSLLSHETASFELITSRSEKFLKPLFLFNIIVSFASPGFFSSAAVLPDLLNSFLFGELGNFTNSIPESVFSIFSYFNALFVIVFIFTPFILAVNSSGDLFMAMRKNILLIRARFSYYLWLILSAIFFLIILSAARGLVSPSPLLYSQSTAEGIMYSTAYSLIFTFFLLTFLITVFRSVINFYRKSDSSE